MVPNFKDDLDQLLSEPLSSARARAQNFFPQAAAPFERVVLFGAGQLGRKLLWALRQSKTEICCFSDNNSSVWGTRIDGVDVLSPALAAERYAGSAAFVVAIWNYSHSFLRTRSQLRLLGCQRILTAHSFLCWLGETSLPHYSLDAPDKIISAAQDVRHGLTLWSDDDSRECYLAFVRARLEMNFDNLPGPRDHYPPDVTPHAKDQVFVDCGAYDGDTLVEFIRRCSDFRQIVAIEPDFNNYRRLQSLVAHLEPTVSARIRMMNVAASEKSGTAPFHATGTMASAFSNQADVPAGETVPVICVPLDDALGDLEPTLIKIDVEGSEMSVLQGARSIIATARTTFAVTTEHRFDDLWTIPTYFKSISEDYRLFLRAHGYEGWDLVCYAVPAQLPRQRLAEWS